MAKRKSGIRHVQYPYTVATRLDDEIVDELKIIAFYDHKKPSSWLRDLVVEAVRRYQRNTQYQRFKREFGERTAQEQARNR